jgi:PAS domain S-box-containing protein
VTIASLLEITIKSLAPVLAALLLYPPFIGWVVQSLWRLFALVCLGELSIMFLLDSLHLGATTEALIDVLSLGLLLAPLLWRLWERNRDNTEALLHLNTLINTIPDAIFFKDGAGRWLTVNPVGVALFRLKGVPWQGKTEEELIELQPEFAEAYRACKSSDEHAWNKGSVNISMETVADTHGNIHPLEVSKVPLFEPDGTRHALVIIGRDITYRVQAEESLRLAASVFESSPEGFMITTAGQDPSIVRVNQALLDITGYSTEEVLGKNPRIFKSGRHSDDFYRDMWHTLATAGG